MSDYGIFQVQGYITKISTMANGLRIFFDTMENIGGEDMERLFALYNKPGWMTFNVRPIEAQDIIDLPPVKAQAGQKTPSQRLRAVLYRVWQQDGKGFTDFEAYYQAQMEKLIEFYKGKIEG
jgi:hypothetical protein